MKLLYMTASSIEEAETIAKLLIEEKLIACANIFPQIISLYEWKSELCKETETVMIAKTTSEHEEAISRLIKKNHSYDCPAIIFMEAKAENDFMGWLERSCLSSSEHGIADL